MVAEHRRDIVRALLLLFRYVSSGHAKVGILAEKLYSTKVDPEQLRTSTHKEQTLQSAKCPPSHF
jgi:hypothetical protein